MFYLKFSGYPEERAIVIKHGAVKTIFIPQTAHFWDGDSSLLMFGDLNRRTMEEADDSRISGLTDLPAYPFPNEGEIFGGDLVKKTLESSERKKKAAFDVRPTA